MNQSKSLSDLINEPINWMLSTRGDGYALGWEGPADFREKAYFLFTNFYEPHNGVSPQHMVISDTLSYIYIHSPSAIKKTLNLYFYVMALKNQEVKVTKGWVGEDGEREFVYEADEEAATKLAVQNTEEFYKTIKNTGFIPVLPKVSNNTYFLGSFVKKELTLIEDYASMVGQ